VTGRRRRGGDGRGNFPGAHRCRVRLPLHPATHRAL